MLAVTLTAAGSCLAEERPIDFVRDVRPILSSKCFACHGPDEAARKADLSLVDFESATAELAPGVAAVVPGDPEASELWLRITDPDDPMPPRSAHAPLDADELDVIRRWIESGASYAPHWAYVTPTRSIDSTDGRDPIDVHLDRRLVEDEIAASGRTDDVTLIRRLSLDLAGLPPTPDEVDAFLADRRGDRVIRVIDRLLASPHFGERLAIHWLDLVRYADSVGYHGDQEHRTWPYRDWVIRAFNENLPFDEFTRMQLAGDLLPDADQDDLVASAYNRLLQTSHEGGLQLEEYRAIYMADRVRNASEVWMGATLGCAQCHDHKYDPYTLRDFHTFGAFFADIDDEEHLRNPYNGYNTSPTRREPEMRVASAESASLLAELDSTRTALLADREARVIRLATPEPDWEASLLAASARGGIRTEIWVDDTLDTGGRASGDWTFHTESDVPAASGTRYRIQRSAGRVQHYTVETNRRIRVEPGSRLVALVHFPADAAPDALMLQVHAGDSWEHRAVWGDDTIDYGQTTQDVPSYRRRGPLPTADTWARLEIPLEDIGLAPGAEIDGIAFTQHGGTVRWDAVTVEHAAVAPHTVIAALTTPADTRTDAERTTIASHRVAIDPDVRAIDAELQALDRRAAEIEARLPLVVFTKALSTPRDVRILPRGDWLDTSGELVEPAVPGFLGSVTRRDPSRSRADRLDLADWLVTPRAEGGVGEFTARVFVNRMWSLFFGTGLCPSVEDFGGQGRPPEHPELLDDLALDFMASGWNVKALIRRIVLTDAYARSSVPTESARLRDPANLLFARQARPRLSAELVRDTALAASGLLVDRLGGPSVKPPQPPGLYRHLNFPEREYRPDMGDDQWRRGVYHHWQRQFLHPMLKAFDAPTREACTAQRPISNTPLAALVLMNDPVFIEAARAMAARVLTGETDDGSRIASAFRLATARTPDDAERHVLIALLDDARTSFTTEPPAAGRLVAAGSAARGTDVPDVELAAWTQVCRAILNLHETYTRD